MKLKVTACGALIALAALATSADARMMGGGGAMSASRISTPTTHTSVSPSLGGSRHSHFKKPIDSDGGGPSDPDPKPTGKGTGGGTEVTGGYYPPRPHPHYPHPYYNDPNQSPPFGLQGPAGALSVKSTTDGWLSAPLAPAPPAPPRA
jgi:hypothetical protein